MSSSAFFAIGLAATLSVSAALPALADMKFKQGGHYLPSADTSKMLEQLPQRGFAEWKKREVTPRELTADPNKLDYVGKQKLEMSDDGMKSVPFVVPNSMIIQFTADTSSSEIKAYLEENNLNVIQTFPGIGAVQVDADISKYFAPKLTDKSQNETILRGITTAISDFQKDERVQSATPDIFLTDKSAEITNVLRPTEIVTAVGNETQEVLDWGVRDIEADQLWSMQGARDGVIFGVMDVGFSRHDDIVFLDFPAGVAADNHGNHVAGIGCGLHNGKGIQGVLPNCFVRARAGDVFFQAVEGNPELGFMVLFSQILATLDRFVTTQEDVSTFNVSLGYNWRSNFGINPDLQESAQWRVLVESQGAFLVTLLKAADEKGKVIFSAAGNDSSGLSAPIKAKYASPFNWAAIIAREQGIAENGIIVGAHDPDGHRADFSNSGGQISCPGVNVVSAVAFDANLQPSTSSYGKMSGTSMASPYCAAAHVLFKLVRPGYTGIEAAHCMMVSDKTTELGTPMLRLTQALNACPDLN
jgi:hypothetical protein